MSEPVTSPDADRPVRLLLTDRRTGAETEFWRPLPVTVGRDPRFCAVVVDDPSLAARHARLDHGETGLRVTDLGSGGTEVDGRPVRTAELRPGDRLGLGAFDVAWSFPEEETSPAARPVSGMPLSPARRVVTEAEARNADLGHDVNGSLSLEHGFLPVTPPLTALPESHRQWDDMVGRLPGLFRSLELRRAFDALPVLDARPAALPDRYLLRASTMLGVFAHSYQYVTVDPPAALPPALLQPWREVSRRLGKELPALSYVDLFFTNWRLRDPAGPRRLANMDLLVPAWGNDAERIFYLVTTEFAMQLAPTLGAMLRAQEAVLGDDREGVEDALLNILETLRHVTDEIYPQIDPNPLGRNHLDQVLWAKTVGTAGVPVFEGAPSPSGTAQPHTHAFDAFFERRAYDSLVGRQSTQLGGHFPPHWRAVVEALREVSVRRYVEDSGHGALRGLYNAVLDAYAGDKGWMGLHRIKAYGFLEVAFKVGREVTTGAKFTGLFKDKTWDRVDQELATVRDERRPAVDQPVVFATPRRGRLVTDADSGAWTSHVELDVAGQGVQYAPGDRLGVLAENDEDLVRRTLRAMQATGDELIHLTPEWQRAVRLRAGYSGDTEVLPLRALLTFGRIRPVGRATAKRLHAVSATGALKRIVDARMEDQWELWDLLNLMHAAGFDVSRLWRADRSDPEHVCHVVAPEEFRLYSIASAMGRHDDLSGARTIRLVVGGLDYDSARSPHSYPRRRQGTASHFLRRMTSDARFRHRQISARIVPTPRFRLPADTSRPIVMFAAGSGAAPFHGFVQARTDAGATGENVLFLGLRTPAEFAQHDDFDRAAARGALRLHTAFSRADSRTRFDAVTRTHVVEEGRRRRVDDLAGAPEHADALWEQLRSRRDGGTEGYFYLCGRTDFAVSVLGTLATIAESHLGSAAAATRFLQELMAGGRLMQDVFTTYAGHSLQTRTYEISDLMTRNTPAEGYWMVVDGRVYDVGDFLLQHVGGPDVVRHYAGLDATEAYRRVLHDVNPEIDAMLGMFELGTMRRLRFGAARGVVLTPDGLRAVALADLFRAWVRYVYLVVGMENALTSDYGFNRATATAGDGGRPTPFKAQYTVEAHRRFLVSYLDGLLGDDIVELWRATVGFCAPDVDVRALAAELEALTQTEDYAVARSAHGHAKRQLAAVAEGAEPAGALGDRIDGLLEAFVREDTAVLVAIKMALREGIRAFEEHEAQVVARAGDRLTAALRTLPREVAGYYARLAAVARAHGVVAGPVEEEPIAADGGVPGHGGPVLTS